MKRILIISLLAIAIFCSCEPRIIRDTADGGETSGLVGDRGPKETLPAPESDTPSESETEAERETEAVTESLPVEDTEKPAPVEIVTPRELRVTVNEVCASNTECFKTQKGDTPDWIELYNSSERAVNLAGYGISDDPSDPMKYTFSNYLIEAGSYVILLAEGNVGYQKGIISLPFTLDTDGGTVVLTSPEGFSDTLVFPSVDDDESYGRAKDGEDIVCHLTATPLASNDTAVSIIKVPVPEFSHKSGFYSEKTELSLSVPDNCIVYYTTDGSTPTEQSLVYWEPIILDADMSQDGQDRAKVIRAVAIDRDGNVSRTVGGTYFIMESERAEAYKNIPILSVLTDGEDLFEGERPAFVEYFDAGHNLGFGQEAGVRISVNGSEASKQSSFELYAEKKYGRAVFDYPLFEGTDSCESFLMLSMGEELFKANIMSLLNVDLLTDRSSATAKRKLCVLFLNGEYWGFYMMAESCDANYFEERYDVGRDNVVSLKDGRTDIGKEEDIGLYEELISFCKNNDLTTAENYKKLCAMIDMQSYMEYVAENIITGNTRASNESMRLWRARSVDPTNPYADGRWRFIAEDAEYSFENQGHGLLEDQDENAYDALLENGLIFGEVYKNEEFKNEFHAVFTELLDKEYSFEQIDAGLDFYLGNYLVQMKKNQERYDSTWDCEAEIEVIREFWRHRREYLLGDSAEEDFLDQ